MVIILKEGQDNKEIVMFEGLPYGIDVIAQSGRLAKM
jgi:hypothetical protein